VAALTIYIPNTFAVAPNWFGNTQIGGTPPSATFSTFGWVVGKTALTTPYFRSRLGATNTTNVAQAASWNASTTGPTKGTGNGNATSGDSFIAGPFNGTFAATAWTFNWWMNFGSLSQSGTGHINMRVWKSANADGSGATQLLANTVGVTGNANAGEFNSSISWSPGSLTLTNEYLFFQIEWQETSLGGIGAGNVFSNNTTNIVTPDFVGTFGPPPVVTSPGFNMPMLGM
jgi:hypothetical protein